MPVRRFEKFFVCCGPAALERGQRLAVLEGAMANAFAQTVFWPRCDTRFHIRNEDAEQRAGRRPYEDIEAERLGNESEHG